jgi:ABC-type transport system substrate-binding protein
MPGFNPLNKIKDNNLELAVQYMERYLDTIGKGMPELELVSAFKTPRVEQEMAMIKQFWGELGIKLKVKYIKGWEKFETYLKTDSVQIYRYAWFADMPDPDSFLYSLFASESPTNFMKFHDNNIDHMLLAARGIVDPVKRAKLYQKIEADIVDLTPLIPLFYMNVNRVYQPYVKSVTMNALGAHTIPLNKIWLDKTSQNE